jgi:hypothetical protein
MAVAALLRRLAAGVPELSPSNGVLSRACPFVSDGGSNLSVSPSSSSSSCSSTSCTIESSNVIADADWSASRLGVGVKLNRPGPNDRRTRGGGTEGPGDSVEEEAMMPGGW